MGSEIDIVDFLLGRWSPGHRITTKRLAHAKLAIAKKDFAVSLHLANLINGAVLQRRQLLGKRAVAHLIATCRHGHTQGFVRPLVIVTMAPAIKTDLHAVKVSKSSLRQQLYFQGPMKALILALGLRMIRPNVNDLNSQVQQPNGQRCVRMLPVMAPRS